MKRIRDYSFGDWEKLLNNKKFIERMVQDYGRIDDKDDKISIVIDELSVTFDLGTNLTIRVVTENDNLASFKLWLPNDSKESKEFIYGYIYGCMLSADSANVDEESMNNQLIITIVYTSEGQPSLTLSFCLQTEVIVKALTGNTCGLCLKAVSQDRKEEAQPLQLTPTPKQMK